MGDQEVGKCDVCGKNGTLLRKYYHYDINCDCCNGVQHFVYISHHKDCIPKPPSTIRISLDGVVASDG